jgi:hypothetical protein
LTSSPSWSNLILLCDTGVIVLKVVLEIYIDICMDKIKWCLRFAFKITQWQGEDQAWVELQTKQRFSKWIHNYWNQVMGTEVHYYYSAFVQVEIFIIKAVYMFEGHSTYLPRTCTRHRS